VAAKGDGSTGRSMTFTVGNGRRGYQVARPRSNTWLWILNAVVIGFVVIAAAASSTPIGHTVVQATYHFLLYYVGVLALIALTAEVAIGLVATDRIFMKPAGRVTMQAIHRATGFGAIAFLVVHIIFEIIAGRATVLDAVIPFLYTHKTFYLGIGTLASDMFIVIMMLGIYRARLATRMSPLTWRLLHATAYLAWLFGLIHGLLGGRPAKPFFGYEGFVYWCYGGCVAAVALALLVRFVAKDRARSHMVEQPVAEAPGGASMAAAAVVAGAGLGGGAALPGAAISAAAVPSARQLALESRPSPQGQPGRRQLALPAGSSDIAAGRTGQFQPTARYDHSGPFGQLEPVYPAGPLGQFGPDHPSAPLPRVTGYEAPGQLAPARRGERPRPRGQGDWTAAYERPMGARRDHPPAPRYERTGEIDRSGPYERPQHEGPQHERPQHERPESGQSGPLSAPLAYGPDDRPGSYDGPGTGGYWERVPRYERTGEIDRSGAYQQQAGYGPGAQAGQGDGLLAQAVRYGRPGQYERPDGDYGPARHQYGNGGEAPGYAPAAAYGRPGQPASLDRPAPYGQPASHDSWYQAGPARRARHAQPAPHREPAGYADAAPYGPGSGPSGGYRPPAGGAQYGAPSGYAAPAEYGAPSGYAAPAQYGPPSGYAAPAQYSAPSGYAAPAEHSAPSGYAAPQYGPPSAPAPAQYGPPGGYEEAAHYGRPAQSEQDRAAHYASFADQDASYTRPRPPGARDHFDPQDETDPLDIVTLNNGNRE
jgi:DMSO/TMAO reductase YedYZ heme-binding membrane subunit